MKLSTTEQEVKIQQQKYNQLMKEMDDMKSTSKGLFIY
jgi:hypothetical protein